MTEVINEKVELWESGKKVIKLVNALNISRGEKTKINRLIRDVIRGYW